MFKPKEEEEKGLHVCPSCSSKMVQPTNWEQTSKSGHWHVWRRCPECEWRGDGIYGEIEIDAYDEVLDRAHLEIRELLQSLEIDAMKHIVNTFTTAIQSDLITADDFA